LAQLAPTVALACEGEFEEVVKGGDLARRVEKNNQMVAECNFRVEQKNCVFTWKVTAGGQGWKLEGREEKGAEFAHRYTVAKETCTLRIYKNNETCKAELAVNNKANGTENEYCWLWGEEIGPLKMLPVCFTLKE
jgi:hypothetical protein